MKCFGQSYTTENDPIIESIYTLCAIEPPALEIFLENMENMTGLTWSHSQDRYTTWRPRCLSTDTINAADSTGNKPMDT